ncbi:hypothetical protein SISSUDRAFT_1121691 [Sistotremastrum suecicum HHB10207 ss-3]|uniref:Uncharacterized protein n=1 Tax=Sistotremastrum suecicum HHB10207 ss-3 TaxID=1314776 RepID=A0A166AGT5_9AGAM|nr:hypothetical protein SISSUDRAFT_1121691 [Sistotremastrum suecicum HHB10207 ss-3]
MPQPQAHSKSSDATLASNGHVCPFCLITHDSEHDNRKWRLLKEIITTERSRRRPIPDPSQSESPGLSYELHPAEEPDSSLLRAGSTKQHNLQETKAALQALSRLLGPRSYAGPLTHKDKMRKRAIEMLPRRPDQWRAGVQYLLRGTTTEAAERLMLELIVSANIVSFNFTLSELERFRAASQNLPPSAATEISVVDDRLGEGRSVFFPDLSFLPNLRTIKFEAFPMLGQHDEFEAFRPSFRPSLKHIFIRTNQSQRVAVKFIVDLLIYGIELKILHLSFSHKPHPNSSLDADSMLLHGLAPFPSPQQRLELEDLKIGSVQRLGIDFIMQNFVFNEEKFDFAAILWQPPSLDIKSNTRINLPITLPSGLERWMKTADHLTYIVDPISDNFIITYASRERKVVHSLYGTNLLGDTAKVVEGGRVWPSPVFNDIKRCFKNVTKARFHGVLGTYDQWKSFLSKTTRLWYIEGAGVNAHLLARSLVNNATAGKTLKVLKVWNIGFDNSAPGFTDPNVLLRWLADQARQRKDSTMNISSQREALGHPLELCAYRYNLDAAHYRHREHPTRPLRIGPSALKTEALFRSHHGLPAPPPRAWPRICGVWTTDDLLESGIFWL